MCVWFGVHGCARIKSTQFGCRGVLRCRASLVLFLGLATLILFHCSFVEVSLVVRRARVAPESIRRGLRGNGGAIVERRAFGSREPWTRKGFFWGGYALVRVLAARQRAAFLARSFARSLSHSRFENSLGSFARNYDNNAKLL